MLFRFDTSEAEALLQQSMNNLLLHVILAKPGRLPLGACPECVTEYPMLETPKLISHQNRIINFLFQCGHLIEFKYGGKSDKIECFHAEKPQINGQATSWGKFQKFAERTAPQWWHAHASYQWKRKPSGYLNYTKFLAMMFPSLIIRSEHAFYLNLAFNRIFDTGPNPIWISRHLAERAWSSSYPATSSTADVRKPESGLFFFPESSSLRTPTRDVCLFMGWRQVNPGHYLWEEAPIVLAIERLILFAGSRSTLFLMNIPQDKPVQDLVFDTSFKGYRAFFKKMLGAFLSLHALKGLNVVKASNQTPNRATQWTLEEKRSPCSHIRGAHWHTYRYGPGKRNTKTLWLDDIQVNGFREATV